MSIVPTQFDWIYQLYIEEQTKKQHNPPVGENQHTEVNCCGSDCEHCKNKNTNSYESRS